MVSDRFADSSRAFQGIAGGLGLDTVNRIHRVAIGDFEPALVVVLDLPETVALERARQRGEGEDRFEKKGAEYQARVRGAYRQIAASDPARYVIIDADSDRDGVTHAVLDAVNRYFALALQPASDQAR